MNDYTGKSCPFCKTEFNHDDEIVVCSECDMPHHKDCWIENQGCTTFGCTGTIKAADNTLTSVTRQQMNYEDVNSTPPAVIYCTKCGSQNSSTSSFCTKCGNRLVTAPRQEQNTPVFTQSNFENTTPYAGVNQQNNYTGNGYSNQQSYQSDIDSEVQQLIGVKAEYYIPEFKKLKSQNKKTSWNWAAFLFTPYWLIYRKMYGYGAGFLGAAFLVSLTGSVFLSILLLAAYFAFGILGNYIYMTFLENNANQAKSMSEPSKIQFIVKNGGVNTTAMVLTIIGYSLLTLMISA